MAGRPTPMDTDDVGEGKSRSLFRSLRRVSSAPLINIGSISDSAPIYESRKPARPRTFSASFSQGCQSLYSAGLLIGDQRHANSAAKENGLRHYMDMGSYPEYAVDISYTIINPVGSPASRVLQIKQEESISDSTREVIRERDVTAVMQLSRSLDEISWLTDKAFNVTEVKRDNNEDFPSAFSSTSMQLSPVNTIDSRVSRTRSLTPSPGPGPLSPKVRSVTRRSLSPSSLRPSAFTPKRKLDAEDSEHYVSPSKRPHLYHSSLSTSSASSSSSPDTGSESVHNLSNFDDGSCSEDSFLYSPSHSSLSNHNNLQLMCDTRHAPFNFVKPKHVAPPSPLAAGSNSASIQLDPRRSSLGATSYTFTPVRD